MPRKNSPARNKGLRQRPQAGINAEAVMAGLAGDRRARQNKAAAGRRRESRAT